MPKKTSRTQAVQAEISVDRAYNAVSPPLYLSSTYNFKGFEAQGAYDYGRGGNPNRDGLGRAIAGLEGGACGIVTASGMAAIDLTTNFLGSEDLIVAPHDCYGGTHRLFTHRQRQGRFKVLFIDQSDNDAVAKAIAQKPKIFFIETPSNPLMRLVDIAALCDAAHSVDARVIVDNTFLSPVRQNPINLGADMVVHSTTKYLNGHSDVVGGCLVTKSEEDGETMAWWANCSGVTGAPFDAFMTLRGMRTLHARMDIQESSAGRIAAFLAGHKAVERVFYPGLENDPGYTLMQKQQSGPGAMLSFELAGGRAGTRTFLENVRLHQLAESLGGVESLVCHPASMTHRGMEPEARAIAGIKDNLVRISVGLESVDDLIADIERSFLSV